MSTHMQSPDTLITHHPVQLCDANHSRSSGRKWTKTLGRIFQDGLCLWADPARSWGLDGRLISGGHWWIFRCHWQRWCIRSPHAKWLNCLVHVTVGTLAEQFPVSGWGFLGQESAAQSPAPQMSLQPRFCLCSRARHQKWVLTEHLLCASCDVST